MARHYRRVDRDQQFMMPPDVKDWVPRTHLVWFVVSVVDALDVSAFQARSRLGGAGRAGYDPRMLLTLLVYAYAMGQRSSRQIERLCRTDTAFMVACGLDAPDHSTIARFRQAHEQALKDLFTQVLVVCARSGLARVGTVAVDGTKIAANASPDANRGRAWLAEQVEQMVAQAAEADAAEDELFGPGRGDGLPVELAHPTTRNERIRQALAGLVAEEAAEKAAAAAAAAAKADAYRQKMTDHDGPGSPRPAGRAPAGVDLVTVAQASLDHEVAVVTRRLADYHERAGHAAAQGRRLPGARPRGVEDNARVRHARAAVERARHKTAEAAEKAKAKAEAAQSRCRDITDPDSRLMPTRKGWLQGYNAQLAVTSDQIILVADVIQQTGDCEAFVPMLDAIDNATGLLALGGADEPVGTVLADAGYRSLENLTAPGPDRLVAAGKGRDDERHARDDPATGPPPEGADPSEAMDHRLRTPEGRALYRRRGATVEPVNGQVKDGIGPRRFARRGLTAVTSELTFAAAVHNLLKLYRAQLPTT